jgi:hypothetical protein
MDEYRRLQKACDSQAALSSSPKVRTALREMAEEYRKRADHNESQELAPDAGAPRQPEKS